MNHPPVRSAAAALVGVVLLAAMLGGAAARTPVAAASNVVVVYDSPKALTMQSALTVSLEVADSSNVRTVAFLFCQLQYPNICFPAVVMTAHGTNWYQGTTKTMVALGRMAVGMKAGFNITVYGKDNVNETEPTANNPFTNLTVVKSVANGYEFEVEVTNQSYGLSGHVVDSATGAGVPGANVTVTPGNGTVSVSDSTGGYSFAGLSNGTYTVSAKRTGYPVASATVAIGGHNAVQDVTLTNSTLPPKPHTSSPNRTAVPFYESTTGLGVIATLAVAVVIVAIVVARRGRGGPNVGQSPPKPAPDVPKPPTQRPG